MTIIKCETYIDAPISICFDLARTTEIHAGKSLLTIQKPIGGTAAVPMEKGDYITWQVSHFGMKQNLTSKIIAMEKPHIFLMKWLAEPFNRLRIPMNLKNWEWEQ